MDGSVEILEDKIRRFKPEGVCIVGKSIWESIWRVRHGRKMKKEEFRYGWQDDVERMGFIEGDGESGWIGARVFVATSTSGLAVSETSSHLIFLVRIRQSYDFRNSDNDLL
jgi:hypothetical protein